MYETFKVFFPHAVHVDFSSHFFTVRSSSLIRSPQHYCCKRVGYFHHHIRSRFAIFIEKHIACNDFRASTFFWDNVSCKTLSLSKSKKTISTTMNITWRIAKNHLSANEVSLLRSEKLGNLFQIAGVRLSISY